MKIHAILFSLLLSLALCAQSPSIISTRNLVWGAASLNYRFTTHWATVSDILYRVEYTDGDVFQAGIRAGGRYITTKNWLLTAGPAYFLHYPDPNGRPPRQEWRSWQEIARKWEFGQQHVFYPRIRFEQRFFREYDEDTLADHFSFHSLRLRLRAEYFYFFGSGEQQRWSLVIGDEFLVRRSANGLTGMDQNRAWAGVQYKFNAAFTLQLVYLHILVQRSASSFEQSHIVRLAFQFMLDRRAKNDLKQE